MFKKALYVIARELSIFSLPGLRKVRNKIYAAYLNAKQINVDRGVKIQALHSGGESSFALGIALHVGSHCVIDTSGSVKIGNRVTLSDGALIFTHTHPIDGGPQDWRKNKLAFGRLDIGDDVWIGANAIVLSSVRTIGQGAVIGAGSIVGKDVLPNTVVAGVPAKYLRDRMLSE